MNKCRLILMYTLYVIIAILVLQLTISLSSFHNRSEYPERPRRIVTNGSEFRIQFKAVGDSTFEWTIFEWLYPKKWNYYNNAYDTREEAQKHLDGMLEWEAEQRKWEYLR